MEAAFANVCRLLKPNGVFVLTVPYSLENHTLERFPELHEYTVTRLGQTTVLVNRTRAGLLQVFDNLIFHFGGGATLEMREFSERDLMTMLAEAGFRARFMFMAKVLNRSVSSTPSRGPCRLPRAGDRSPSVWSPLARSSMTAAELCSAVRPRQRLKCSI